MNSGLWKKIKKINSRDFDHIMSIADIALAIVMTVAGFTWVSYGFYLISNGRQDLGMSATALGISFFGICVAISMSYRKKL